MGDMHCGCRKPDITIFEMCRSCGDPVNFEDLRQQAINTYDRDGQPIEDPNLPRRHLLIENPRNSLRVLHLDDDASPILSGTFERASITHLPSYEAVSYCWGGDDGDYTKSEFIIIGGRLFPITKNCAAVLRKIRKTNGRRVIWIDSLCINQNDVKERSVQVSQMDKIFSGAQKVHMFLGNNVDDGTVSTAFYVLRSMGNLYDFNMRLRNGVEALRIMFDQTYFSRMWIIQEVLLAKTAELHWRSDTIPWQTFSEGHLQVIKKYGIESSIPEWMRIRAATKNFRKSETLGKLLFSAMYSTASNDRDKVYGIYGLLFDAKEEGLTVDYSLSVREVFTNIAGHLIKKHNALRSVLRHTGRHLTPVDGGYLPSWVPNFRSRHVPNQVPMSFDGSTDLKIRSSISAADMVSGLEKDELYLLGHRLRIFEGRCEASTEYSKVVRCKIGGQELKWEIRAKFPVTFDSDEHVIFWMSDGLLLHLERHLTREDAYTLLGECTLKHCGPFPTLVVHNRHTNFADAMFGSELQDLTPLWKLYTKFRSTIPYNSQLSEPGNRPMRFPDRVMGPEETNRVVRAYQTFRTSENSEQRSLTSYFGEPDGFEWTCDLVCVPKPDSEGEFSLKLALDPGEMTSGGIEDGTREAKIKRMFDFESFCESQSMWKTLHSLKLVLQWPESYDIRAISKLCESWLRHNKMMKKLYWEAFGNLGAHKDGEAREDRESRTKILEELKSWETTTEELSEALRWAEGFFWPFEELPDIRVWQDDNLIPLVFERRKSPTANNNNDEEGEAGYKPAGKESTLLLRELTLLPEPLATMLVWPVLDTKGKAEQKKAEDEAKDSPLNKKIPDWVFKDNFERFRSELDEDHQHWRYSEDLLFSWSRGWAEAIEFIAYFFVFKKKLNLENCLRLEESCMSRGIWKNEKMEVCQAEIITLL